MELSWAGSFSDLSHDAVMVYGLRALLPSGERCRLSFPGKTQGALSVTSVLPVYAFRLDTLYSASYSEI